MTNTFEANRANYFAACLRRGEAVDFTASQTREIAAMLEAYATMTTYLADLVPVIEAAAMLNMGKAGG